MKSITLGKCPLCDSCALKSLPAPGNWIGPEFFSRLDLGLSRCRKCSFIFTNPRPSPEALRDFYDHCETYECHHASAEGSTANMARFLLSHCGPPNGRLLDMGCGAGFLVRAARAVGWDAIGFDISRQALAACRAQGIPATGDLSAVGKVSVVVSNYALEHVSEWDKFFGQIRSVLLPGGRTVIVAPHSYSLRARIATVTRRWTHDERFRAFPIHLSYFSRATFARLLSKYGLEPTYVGTHTLALQAAFRTRETIPAGRAEAMSGASESPARNTVKRVLFGLGAGNGLIGVSHAVSI